MNKFALIYRTRLEASSPIIIEVPGYAAGKSSKFENKLQEAFQYTDTDTDTDDFIHQFQYSHEYNVQEHELSYFVAHNSFERTVEAPFLSTYYYISNPNKYILIDQNQSDFVSTANEFVKSLHYIKGNADNICSNSNSEHNLVAVVRLQSSWAKNTIKSFGSITFASTITAIVTAGLSITVAGIPFFPIAIAVAVVASLVCIITLSAKYVSQTTEKRKASYIQGKMKDRLPAIIDMIHEKNENEELKQQLMKNKQEQQETVSELSTDSTDSGYACATNRSHAPSRRSHAPSRSSRSPH